ncbi:MAG: hypothetical protein KGI50_00160 [Patescibacteria group bacterium]|nr:hypothetical protein [Patescibacteria group bacterium]MDE2438225.1 hypothetical protein [Patescibacteria group bacterium]
MNPNTWITNLINSSNYLFLKDIVYLGIAGGGLWVANQGLSTWKKQIKGHVEYDTARRLYRAVLKLRDAVGYVRNPAIFPSESEEAQRKYFEESVGTTNAVYRMRWEKMVEALSDLQAEQLEGEILWGKDVVEKIKPLRTCVTRLNLAVSDHLRPVDKRIRGHKEIFEIIYELRTDKEIDDFSKEIDASIDIIGDFLRNKYDFPS